MKTFFFQMKKIFKIEFLYLRWKLDFFIKTKKFANYLYFSPLNIEQNKDVKIFHAFYCLFIVLKLKYIFQRKLNFFLSGNREKPGNDYEFLNREFLC